jgi:hypothetical protein
LTPSCESARALGVLEIEAPNTSANAISNDETILIPYSSGWFVRAPDGIAPARIVTPP